MINWHKNNKGNIQNQNLKMKRILRLKLEWNPPYNTMKTILMNYNNNYNKKNN